MTHSHLNEPINSSLESSYCLYEHRPSLDAEDALALTDWLRSLTGWSLVHQPFYEIYEVFVTKSQYEKELQTYLGRRQLSCLIKGLEGAFSVAFAPFIKVTAHRMLCGQWIGLHVDSPKAAGETHRAVIHLVDPAAPPRGGELVFCYSRRASDVRKEFPVYHNSLTAFELNDRAFHFVREVKAGIRYTLILSFWEKDAMHNSPESIRIFQRQLADGLVIPACS